MFSFLIVALGSMGRQQTYGFIAKLRAKASQLSYDIKSSSDFISWGLRLQLSDYASKLDTTRLVYKSKNRKVDEEAMLLGNFIFFAQGLARVQFLS
jgi:hypothetical protein